jgi:hypothetical protein
MEKLNIKNMCVVCKKSINKKNWIKIKKIYEDMLNQIDRFGEDSLTEHQQILYHNKVHTGCYHLLQ